MGGFGERKGNGGAWKGALYGKYTWDGCLFDEERIDNV